MEIEYSFKKLIGPYGIPIYHHPAPSVIKAVAMTWVVFTGAADDESIGAPGLYHWFEHVPFRGTKKFPGGAKETMKRITSVGGRLNANTGTLRTAYESVTPISEWKYGLSVITDLFAQPLLKEEDIIKEREIIFQEIARSRASLGGLIRHEEPRILFPKHPFGKHVLGSEESLLSVTPDVLIKAHRFGYDRSRIALVVCGNISETELLDEVEKLADTFPNNGLTPRTKGAYYGQLPAWNITPYECETDFSESVVQLLFPTPQAQTAREAIVRGMAIWMFSFGGLSSPFKRILREDRNLIYTGGITSRDVPGGGYSGFHAQAKKENINAIIKAFDDVLADPEVYSVDRLNLIRSGKIGEMDISSFDASEKVDGAVEDLVDSHGIISCEEIKNLISSVTFEEVLQELKLFNRTKGKLLVFRGMGS